jgi:hypothetical protein
MVKVNDVYYDGYLQKNLNILKKNIKDDWDFWFIIDGLEGTGKSMLGQQCGALLDPNITIKNIVFTPQQFDQAVDELPPYSVLIWDEAITGTQSTDMTKMARTLQKKAVQMRQKNLYVILILHSYYELKKYYAIHRTWFLLNCYYTPNMETEKLERGFFKFYGRDAKRLMYCNDKLRRNYDYPGAQQYVEFRGRFYKNYVVDEAEYKAKKAKIHEEQEGISDKEFAVAAFKRGMSVNMIQAHVSISDRHLYRIKEELTERH